MTLNKSLSAVFFFLHPSNCSWNRRKTKRGKAILALLLCHNHLGACLVHNMDRISSVRAWDTSSQEECAVLSTSVPEPPPQFPSLCPLFGQPWKQDRHRGLSNFILNCTESRYSLEDICSNGYHHRNAKKPLNITVKKPQLIPHLQSQLCFHLKNYCTTAILTDSK